MGKQQIRSISMETLNRIAKKYCRELNEYEHINYKYESKERELEEENIPVFKTGPGGILFPEGKRENKMKQLRDEMKQLEVKASQLYDSLLETIPKLPKEQRLICAAYIHYADILDIRCHDSDGFGSYHPNPGFSCDGCSRTIGQLEDLKLFEFVEKYEDNSGWYHIPEKKLTEAIKSLDYIEKKKRSTNKNRL